GGAICASKHCHRGSRPKKSCAVMRRTWMRGCTKSPQRGRSGARRRRFLPAETMRRRWTRPRITIQRADTGNPFMSSTQRVAILGGVRIPFCRNNTAYADIGNFGMAVKTLGALVEKFNLHGEELGEVAFGAVIKHASDWNLAREATLSSG